MSETTETPEGTLPPDRANHALGFIAVHPETEMPFCVEDDACVIMGDRERLRSFIEQATGDRLPDEAFREAPYGGVLDELMEGYAFAFDRDAYAAFVSHSDDDDFEAPPFDDVAVVEVPELNIELAVLAYDDSDDEDYDGEDGDEEDSSETSSPDR